MCIILQDNCNKTQANRTHDIHFSHSKHCTTKGLNNCGFKWHGWSKLCFVSGRCQHAHGWKALWTDLPPNESYTGHADRPGTHHRKAQHQRHARSRFPGQCLQQIETSIRNGNDKYSADMFPNASCLEKPHKNKIHDALSSLSILHSNCLVLKGDCLKTSIHPTWYALHGRIQMQCTEQTDGRWEESLMPTATTPS